MKGVKVTTVEVRDQRFDVNADAEGRWWADFDGREMYAESLETLRQKLVEATRKAGIKLEVPFVTTETGRRGSGTGAGQRGTVYGIHGGTGNFMVRWADGSKDQLSYVPKVMGELSDQELEDYRGLIKNERLAQRRREAFEADHRADLNALVREQLDAQRQTTGGRS